MRRLSGSAAAVLLCAAHAHSGEPLNCERLTSVRLPRTSVLSAVRLPARSWNEIPNLPGICRVTGEIKPADGSEILFELWLPLDNWNGKFSAVGNGGWGGSVSRNNAGQGGGLAAQVRRGYASASSNTGHQESAGLDQARFAFERPESLIDFAYRAAHETTLASKALIKEFYGQLPRHSYWIGASTGGYQGLMEAQRFPADYDGILAGAPANNWTSQMAGMLNEILAVSRDSASRLPDSALQMLHRAILSKCDARDGVSDGVLEDPRQCVFDAATLACEATPRPKECLTPSQVVAAKRIYEGLRDSRTGAQIFPGFSVGSEPLWNVWANDSNIQEIPISYFRWIVFADSAWDWRAFDFSDSKSYDTLRQSEARLAPIMNATDPDLREFRRRGGKLIQWHGWADHVIAAENSINYYNSVLSFFDRIGTSRDETRRDVQSFYRLFMVPGLSHRPPNAGPASIAFDMQTALEDWVERGHPPERVVATYPTKDISTRRTHPLCPYPAVAGYSGKGDMSDTASYNCGKRDTRQ